MKKKIIWFIIFLSVIISLISVFQRYNIENKNKNVELVLDDELLQDLKSKNGINNNLLSDLKKVGITGIAVFKEDIEYLRDSGLISLLKVKELREIKDKKEEDIMTV